jgi:tetratricopeptide (TPR) repeat protein
MTAKTKIAVVASDLVQPRFLALFEALRGAFDVCVYALNSEALVNLHGTGLKLRLFENIPDMPGYLRGLEEELAQCDAIIGLETSRLGTFQAVRAARKFDKPLAVVVNEHLPFFYERYANIRAIQFDICNKADLFLATSSLAAHALQLDRVPLEAIKRVRPVVNTQKFRPSPEARTRFRQYVGIGPDELVVLFHSELEAWNRPELVVQAYHLLARQRLIDPARVRLLFAGTGALAPDLKYRCFALGIGRAAMFLHQDPEPFIADLYAASDILAAPRPMKTEFHEELPLFVLEAMASGVAPVVGVGSLAQEFAAEAAQVSLEDSPEALAATLHRLLGDHELLRRMSMTATEIARTRHGGADGDAIVAEIQALIAGHRQRLDGGAGRANLAEEVETLRRRFEQGHIADALVRIEELLLADPPASSEKAELLCMKGEALQVGGELEGAMNAFSDSLKINDKNPRCYRGLGVISWQGHSNEEALMFYRKALALGPDDSETMLGIGLVYRRLGLVEDALFWLEKCLSRDDYPPSAVVALTQSCMEAPRTEYCIKVLERVIDVVGEGPSLLMTLGQLYMNTGRVEQGHAMLQRALGDTKASA